MPNPVFRVHFRSNEDWEAWERLSKMKGEFLYDSTIQMGHRIHEESETSIIIGDNARSKEDYEMFCKFWPKSIAKVLSKVYAKSEKEHRQRKIEEEPYKQIELSSFMDTGKNHVPDFGTNEG